MSVGPSEPSWFRDALADVVKQAEGAGWTLQESRPIAYGRLTKWIDPGGGTATLACYFGKKGFRVVPGGAQGQALASILDGKGQASTRKSTNATRGADTESDPFGAGFPRIGADESGKGDYFGPLVVASFYLKEETLPQLDKLGVTDSKTLSDRKIQSIAGVLERLAPHEVRVLVPEAYNPIYDKIRNINTLLSQEHGACISTLASAEHVRPKSIIVDRYSVKTKPLEDAIRVPKAPKLITETKGERDPAVAAASILARAAFVKGLGDLSSEYGVTFPLGAGAPVLKAGKAFVRDFGRDALRGVAKVHFKTTEQLGGG